MIDVLIPCKDGGDEHLVTLVRSLEAQSDVKINIEILFNSGERLCDVRNQLLRRTSNEYVYFIDADDYLPTGRALVQLAKALDENPDCDFAWGDFTAYITPRDLHILIEQYNVARKALGSWMARRSSFTVDPWRPMSEEENHRSDWRWPEEWKGVYVHFPIFVYRIGWSEEQNTSRPPRVLQ